MPIHKLLTFLLFLIQNKIGLKLAFFFYNPVFIENLSSSSVSSIAQGGPWPPLAPPLATSLGMTNYKYFFSIFIFDSALLTWFTQHGLLPSVKKYRLREKVGRKRQEPWILDGPGEGDLHSLA